MTERHHCLVALCRTCDETFQGMLRWEDSTGSIIEEDSQLISLIQQHHLLIQHFTGSHNNYGLFANTEQLKKPQEDPDKIAGPLGFVTVSSQCYPMGTVYGEEIKETPPTPADS
jgi:hypothetical protein